MPGIHIDQKRTALVVIDLQKGIATRPTEPYTAREVVTNAARLADAFRRRGMPVFLVHVVSSPGTMLRVTSDEQFVRPDPLPPGWSDFVAEMGPQPTDIIISKRQWGAFYGTDLELQLRRRGLTTIVLCGISTNFGVESTARFAYEYGFEQVFAEDAMASMSVEGHAATIKFIFPRMGKVRSTQEILDAMT